MASLATMESAAFSAFTSPVYGVTGAFKAQDGGSVFTSAADGVFEEEEEEEAEEEEAEEEEAAAAEAMAAAAATAATALSDADKDDVEEQCFLLLLVDFPLFEGRFSRASESEKASVTGFLV